MMAAAAARLLSSVEMRTKNPKIIITQTHKQQKGERWEIVELAWCVVLRVGASWGFIRLARGSEGRRPRTQPSDTGGDTQPYFSWVFTRDLKVASASLRLNAFLDFPAFLHIRPCEERQIQRERN